MLSDDYLRMLAANNCRGVTPTQAMKLLATLAETRSTIRNIVGYLDADPRADITTREIARILANSVLPKDGQIEAPSYGISDIERTPEPQSIDIPVRGSEH